MLRQHNVVVKCPQCGQLAQYETHGEDSLGHEPDGNGPTVSGTDSRAARVGRCGGCGSYYWIQHAEELGGYLAGDGGAPTEWTSAPRVRPLSEAEYLDAIAAGMASTPDLERRLRISAWWAGDAVRRDAPAPARATPGSEESPAMGNVRQLAGLIAKAGAADKGTSRLIPAKAAALRRLLARE